MPAELRGWGRPLATTRRLKRDRTRLASGGAEGSLHGIWRAARHLIVILQPHLTFVLTAFGGYAQTMPKSRVRKSARRGNPPRPKPAGTTSWVATRGFALPAVSFPADIVGADAPEFANVYIDVVMADADSVEHLRLPLTLTRRLLGPHQFELWGQDVAGAFTVHLSGRLGGPWTLGARVSADVLDGHQMRDVLRVLRGFTAARRVALVPAGTDPQVWSDLPHTTVSEPIPPDLEAVVEAHAYVEEALDVRIPAPVTYTAADVRDTLETAALLRGETVKQDWATLDWPMPTREADTVLADLFSDSGQARLEVQREWTWTIGSTETPVGTVNHVYASVRVARTARDLADPDTTVLTLEPGTDPALRVRLVSVTGTAQAEPSAEQRWFWTPHWQQREREVDEHVAAGRIAVYDNAEALFGALDTQGDRPDE